jgi:hypothetical protein
MLLFFKWRRTEAVAILLAFLLEWAQFSVTLPSLDDSQVPDAYIYVLRLQVAASASSKRSTQLLVSKQLTRMSEAFELATQSR